MEARGRVRVRARPAPSKVTPLKVAGSTGLQGGVRACKTRRRKAIQVLRGHQFVTARLGGKLANSLRLCAQVPIEQGVPARSEFATERLRWQTRPAGGDRRGAAYGNGAPHCTVGSGRGPT